MGYALIFITITTQMSHTKGKLVAVHDMKAYGVVDTYISMHS